MIPRTRASGQVQLARSVSDKWPLVEGQIPLSAYSAILVDPWAEWQEAVAVDAVVDNLTGGPYDKACPSTSMLVVVD